MVERLSSNADYMMAQCPSMCSAGKVAAEAADTADAGVDADAVEEAAGREGKRILEQVLG